MVRLLALLPLLVGAHPYDDDWLMSRMSKDPAAFRIALDPALAAEHRVQILVSFVREEAGAAGAPKKWVLERHGFRVDAEYFYPASAVKTCGAIASMLRFKALRAEGVPVGLDTPLVFHPALPGERRQAGDAVGDYTLGRITRQMSLVSSNEAFNRLYELAGHEWLNTSMQAAGLKDTVFTHRLSRVLSGEQNRKTPRIDLLFPGKGKKNRVHTLPETMSPLTLRHAGLPGLDIGEAHLDPVTGARVEAPMPFHEKNRMSLVDLQNMLVMVVRPDVDVVRPGEDRALPGFALDEGDRAFLKEAMRQRPGESKDPVYPEAKFSPMRFKPVLPGLLRVGPLERWQVFNKAGKAYGFRIENAYVVDTKAKKGFFITVNVLANPNRVMNDGQYAYDQLADPLIHGLAELVARELAGR